MDKDLQGQDTRKNICVCLQEPEAVLTEYHVLAHKALTLPANHKGDALTHV